MKSFLILFIFTIILSFSATSQFGKFESTQDKKGRFQFVNTETQEVIFKKCSSIKPISGDLDNTHELYKRFVIIKKRNEIYLFDTEQEKVMETIKCDSLTFREISDGYAPDQMQSDAKKKVIQGKTHSRKKNYNNLIFLINVATAETRGFYPDKLNIKYDRYRKVLIYDAYYFLLRNEDFENLHPILGDLQQYKNGYFSGKNAETGEYGVLNRNAEEVIPFKYIQLRHLHNIQFSAVDVYGKVGMIKEGDEIVIPFEYDCFEASYGSCNVHYRSLENGFYLMKKENKLTVIDSLNQEIIPPGKYDRIKHSKDSLLWIKCSNDLWGVFDMKNKQELISCEYDQMNHYGKYLIVERNEKIGFLKLQNGKLLTPLIYDAPYKEFKNDSTVYLILKKDGRKGVFATDGKEIIPCIYDDISFENNFLLIKHKGLYGLFDIHSFQEILPIEFSKINTYRKRIEKYQDTEIKKGKFKRDGTIIWNE